MTLAENRHEARGEKGPGVSPSRVAPDRTVLTLLRAGTRRCRLAAAFLAVVVGLVGQTANVAFAQARQDVLYLDAPAVSNERASRAGEVTEAYSMAAAGVSAPPEYAREAFASVTAPDGEGVDGVTAEAALRAGEEMLAQLEGSPSEDEDSGEDDGEDGGGGGELAAAGTVRPHLGEKTTKPDAKVSETAAGPTAQPTRRVATSGQDDAETPDPAPPKPGGPTPAEGPSGSAGLAIPAPSTDSGEEEPEDLPREGSPTELASAPSGPESGPQGAATPKTPKPNHGTDDEPYGPAGPISDTGREPVERTTPDPDTSDTSEEPGSAPDTAGQSAPAPAEPPRGADTGPTGGEGDEIAVVPAAPLESGEDSPSAGGPFAAPAQSEEPPSGAAEQPPAEEGRPAEKADDPGRGDGGPQQEGGGAQEGGPPQQEEDGGRRKDAGSQHDDAPQGGHSHKKGGGSQGGDPQQEHGGRPPESPAKEGSSPQREQTKKDAGPSSGDGSASGGEKHAQRDSDEGGADHPHLKRMDGGDQDRGSDKQEPHRQGSQKQDSQESPAPQGQHQNKQQDAKPQDAPRQDAAPKEPLSKESTSQLNLRIAPVPPPKPTPAPEAAPAPAQKPEPAGSQDGGIKQNIVVQSGSPEAGKPGSSSGRQASQDNSIIVNAAVPYDEGNSVSVVNGVVQNSSPALEDPAPLSSGPVVNSEPLPGVAEGVPAVYEIVESLTNTWGPGNDAPLEAGPPPSSLQPATFEPVASEPPAQNTVDSGGGFSSNGQVSQVSMSGDKKK